MGVVRVGLDAVRVAIGLLFLLSAIGKLRDPRGFVRGTVAFRVLPRRLAIVFGVALIPLEAVVALALLGGWFVGAAVALGLCLLASFFVAVAINVRRDRAVPCFCFGAASAERVSKRSLVRIGLLIAATMVVGLDRWLGIGSVSSSSSGGPYFDQWLLDGVMRLTLAAFVLAAGAWILALPDLVRPWRQILRRAE